MIVELVMIALVFTGVMIAFRMEARRMRRERILALWAEITIGTREVAEAFRRVSISAEQGAESMRKFGMTMAEAMKRATP